MFFVLLYFSQSCSGGWKAIRQSSSRFQGISSVATGREIENPVTVTTKNTRYVSI